MSSALLNVNLRQVYLIILISYFSICLPDLLSNFLEDIELIFEWASSQNMYMYTVQQLSYIAGTQDSVATTMQGQGVLMYPEFLLEPHSEHSTDGYSPTLDYSIFHRLEQHSQLLKQFSEIDPKWSWRWISNEQWELVICLALTSLIMECVYTCSQIGIINVYLYVISEYEL